MYERRFLLEKSSCFYEIIRREVYPHLNIVENLLTDVQKGRKNIEWDVMTGEPIKTYGRPDDLITSVSYSPDGKKFLSINKNGTMNEWDTISGECIKSYRVGFEQDKSVYSPDEKRVFSIPDYNINNLEEWNTETGQLIKTYKGHNHKITNINFGPDGKKIASGSEDRTIRIWDINAGDCIRVCEGHTGTVESVCFSPDSKRILSGSRDNTIREWDIETGAVLKVIPNIAGLFIQGADMSNLHPDSDIGEEEKEILRLYGAITDGPERCGKRDIVITEKEI